MSGEAVTLAAIRRRAAQRLAAGAVPGEGGTAALDARLLIAAALGLSPSELVLADHRTVSPAEAARIDAFLDRRLKGEPVARIVGFREFFGLRFDLVPETLVPRPDTETLVEAVLAYFDRRGGRERVLTVVDIGTGSGAILIALLTALPSVTGLGIDLSEGAARAARDNAARLGVAERALFVSGRWSDAAAPADVIVSNPPYIESSVIGALAREVRDFDPRLALDGGPDGLDAYRAIISDLRRALAPDGSAFLEIGYDQAQLVAGLLAEAGFASSLHHDLAGHDRVLEVVRVA